MGETSCYDINCLIVLAHKKVRYRMDRKEEEEEQQEKRLEKIE